MKKARYIDADASARDAGHPDHDELRERKMALAHQRMSRDLAREHFEADRMPRMGAQGPEARRGRPMGPPPAMGAAEQNDEYP